MAVAPVDLPHYYQETDHTCGPATMRMVIQGILGEEKEEAEMALAMGTAPAPGTRQRAMLAFALHHGLQATEHHTDTTIGDIHALMESDHVVVVCYFIPEEGYDHYAIVHRIGQKHVYLLDPWFGPERRMTIQDFDDNWRSDPTVPTRRHRWLMAIKVPDVER